MLGVGAIASAQTTPSNIVPDATLGSESSQVTSDLQNDFIEGGAERGRNLFHSFREFNVSQGRGAYFFVPNDTIQNVLTRITGNSPSEILGTLGTFRIQDNQALRSPANLFLINPNGLIFGQNSTLAIGGSFVATTANAVQFGDRGSFSASQPTLPDAVLTIEPSALLYSAIAPQTVGIVDRSTRVSRNGLIGSTTGLQVSDGKSLLLIGGDVVLDGGSVNVGGGRIELGGLAATGTIQMSIDPNLIRLTFADQERSNVSLINGARVRVFPVGERGSIAIHARNLNVTDESLLYTGDLSSTEGSNPTFESDITLDISENTRLANGSLIVNVLEDGIRNTGGDINLKTNSLEITEGSGISIGTVGKGNTGNVNINATDRIDLSQEGVIVARVLQGATGNAGNVNITTRAMRLTSGGQVQAGTRGIGNAGNIYITARDTIFADGEAGPRRSSSILTTVEPGAAGRGGNIDIKAGSIQLSNGAQLVASTRGRGDAGNVTIAASGLISLDGIGEDNAPTAITSNVNLNSIGQGGTITLTADVLRLTNGAQLQAFTRGQGSAGNINVKTNQAIVFDGEGVGFSGITTGVQEVAAIGNSGNIDLQTDFLLLINGGGISSGTSGQGNGGSITVTAPNILLDGQSPRGTPSSIESAVNANAQGNGGNILINSDVLLVSGSANLEARTFGIGNAGAIQINASDRIVFNQGDVFASVQAGARGRGGNITINTGSIAFLNVSQLISSTRGIGDAGTIKITARDRVLFEGGFNAEGNTASGAVSSVDTGAIGQGGQIEITTGSLFLFNGAQINALTRGKGNAGTVTVNARDAVVIEGRNPIGLRSSIGSTSELRAEGNGGDVRITAGSLFLGDGGALSAGSSTQGTAGNIFATVGGLLQLQNGSILTNSFRSSGGRIDISADRIRLTDSSGILTSVLEGRGNGGGITLTARSILALENSDIVAFAREGRGGDITLNTRAFFGQNYRPAPPGTDAFSLFFNDQADVNASGAVSGVVTLPDTTFIQNSLNQLSQTAIDTNTLLANSCIARNQQNGTFYVTGTGGLPTNPGELSVYSTGTVQATWQRGDPIVEPQGVYPLPNGQLVLSRECK